MGSVALFGDGAGAGVGAELPLENENPEEEPLVARSIEDDVVVVEANEKGTGAGAFVIDGKSGLS